MAITIIKQPQQLQPVYNEIVFVIQSDLSAEENFRFVTEVEVDGNIIAVIETPVNPEGYGVIDIHKHLENYLTNDFNPTSDTVIGADKSIVKYSVNFYERFNPVWEYDGIYNVPTPTGGTTLEFFSFGTIDPDDYFDIGDTILVIQTPPFQVVANSGLAVISSMFFDNVQNAYVIQTSKPFTSPTTFPNAGIITLTNQRSTTLPVGAVVTDKEAFNGVLTFTDFINWDFNQYNSNTILSNGNWLTNAPNSYSIKSSSYLWLNVYSNLNNLINWLKVTVGLQDYYFPIIQGTKSLLQVPITPSVLNGLNWEDISGGEPTLPFNLTSGVCFSITVTASDKNDVLIIPQTFCINDNCTRYEDIQLVFMDKLGSFIPFHFDLVNRQNNSIKRVNFQKDYGVYAMASTNWKYKTYSRGTSSLDTQVNETFTITSNWVNQTQSDFLMTLFESPEVYWFKEDGTVLAINITNTSVERKQVINDLIINYTINFELANKNNKQLG